MVRRRQHWLAVGGAGSVWSGTDWYLVVLGQYSLMYQYTAWYLVKLGQYKAFIPVRIEKSGDLVGCHHSGTNEKGKIGLQWTALMSKNALNLA